MRKQLLTASSIVVLLLVGSVPASAQTQYRTLLAQTQPSPQVTVSSEELEKFAIAIKQLLALEQESQQQIVQAIQKQGFSEERFKEIYQAQQNPSAQAATNISPEEKQKFEMVIAQAIEIQQQNEEKQKDAVLKQNLELKRFTEILTAVKENPQLKQQVQQLLQK